MSHRLTNEHGYFKSYKFVFFQFFESSNFILDICIQNVVKMFFGPIRIFLEILGNGKILRSRYLELLPLCDLTLKWSNFFPIGRISSLDLEKYVMLQHQVCLCFRTFFDFVCFPRFWLKKVIFDYFLI